MEKLIITGGKKLRGSVVVSGAKNMALKAMVAACLTDEEVVIHNVPLVSDFFVMAEIIEHLGGSVTRKDHSVTIHAKDLKKDKISLEKAAEIRTSSMFLAPLLARNGRAIIPNPGGCRIGARPIDRTVEGFEKMGVSIAYNHDDGFFHAKTKRMHGTVYRFDKNTHTGTETLLLAAVLADGETVLENAAQEPEVDELITLLTSMGANIKRMNGRKIVIRGVERLHGTKFRVGPDRNEIVTFAIAAMITKGDVFVREAQSASLESFLEKVTQAGGKYSVEQDGIRFFTDGALVATNISTSPHPGFMTDWQGPWTVLMTSAQGESTIHETVYENRFGYVQQLQKMGARITLFEPAVEDPKHLYNFNLGDDKAKNMHGVKVHGPTALHNGVLQMEDLRAGATLVLAALAASGESVIYGLSHLDRGYESFEKRLKGLGARIRREEE